MVDARDNWTFATQRGDSWQKSSRRFHKLDDAIAAASEWLKVNAINQEFPAVKIVDLVFGPEP